MMHVHGGAQDVTTYFVLRLAADGTEATGLTITNFDLQYVRSGASPAAKVDATALAATNSAHGDNQAIEIDATDQPGLYRVDWPDAAFAAGVREVILSVKCATAFTEHLRVMIDPPVNVEQWNATDVPSEHTAGYPIVTIKDGTGTGEINTNSGAVALVDLVTTATSVTNLHASAATAAELAKVPKSDSNVTWNATALASIQSEANDALVANNLDHLVLIAVDTNFATTVHADSVIGHLADNGAGFDRTTDSLEAIRDRGDAAWTTATGFSTHSAADVWAVATRVLTAGTNINGSTFTSIPWNAAWDAEVQSEAADAIAAAFTFSTSGIVDANIERVNNVAVAGSGTLGDEWGPA